MRRPPRLTIVNPIAVPAMLWCAALLLALLTTPNVRVDEHPLLFVRGLVCLVGFAASLTLALPWLWVRADSDGVGASVGSFLWTHRIEGFGVAARKLGRLRLYVVTCAYGDRTVVLRATASRHWWRAAAHRRRLELWWAEAAAQQAVHAGRTR
ncbi:hypothetical protein [Micropruina sp.]|uniref:hypothetical protein n=1 Tax=Micropruina sp. TaxID=2737536 RepID=UPI0039E23304